MNRWWNIWSFLEYSISIIETQRNNRNCGNYEQSYDEIDFFSFRFLLLGAQNNFLIHQIEYMTINIHEPLRSHPNSEKLLSNKRRKFLRNKWMNQKIPNMDIIVLIENGIYDLQCMHGCLYIKGNALFIKMNIPIHFGYLKLGSTVCLKLNNHTDWNYLEKINTTWETIQCMPGIDFLSKRIKNYMHNITNIWDNTHYWSHYYHFLDSCGASEGNETPE